MNLKGRKIEDIRLYFYNDDEPDSEYKHYWTNDFDKIFNI